MHKSSSFLHSSQLHLHVICEGLLNLGLSLHHSTGSISSDNKPTTPTVHIQPYCALKWCIIVPNPGPWSGTVWEFVKKQKQRKHAGNALAFELISAAAWRVLHRFFACSPQTAQTVTKSSLKLIHIRMRCVPACGEYIYQSNLLHPFILLASPTSISASTEATQQNPTVVDTHLREHAL